MDSALAYFTFCCDLLITALLRLALFVFDLRATVPKRLRKWRGSLRQLLRSWLLCIDRLPPPRFHRCSSPWNRTPEFREEQVVRLHLDFPHLGAGQLRWLLHRLFGWLPARETVRQIIIRRNDLQFQLVSQRRQPRRIRVTRSRQLWGVDLALVWVLGFIPVWLLAAVDYHGSRLVAFELLPWPSAAQIVRVLDDAFRREGAPKRLLSDRGPQFRSESFQLLMFAYGVRHVLTLPAHPWTNGRVERIFRTFRETVRRHFWLIASRRQLVRICADFLLWYNRDRPHSAWAGRTPNEVYFARPQHLVLGPIECVTYFDGCMPWFRFG